MSSISFASQAGNYVLIAVLVIVLAYGAIYNHFHIDASMLWPRKYFEIADMFGVICFSMGVGFIGLSSRVFDSLHQFSVEQYGESGKVQ